MLRNVMPKWYRDQEMLSSLKLKPQEQLFRFNPNPPRILPFMVTNYSIRSGYVTEQPSRWILTLRDLTKPSSNRIDSKVRVRTTPQSWTTLFLSIAF